MVRAVKEPVHARVMHRAVRPVEVRVLKNDERGYAQHQPDGHGQGRCKPEPRRFAEQALGQGERVQQPGQQKHATRGGFTQTRGGQRQDGIGQRGTYGRCQTPPSARS